MIGCNIDLTQELKMNKDREMKSRYKFNIYFQFTVYLYII